MTAGALRRSRALRFALAAGLIVAASQALLWYAYYGHGAKTLVGDEQHYQDTALAILAGGPWIAGSIWPPLQPMLLAAVYGVAGVHVLAAQLLQGLLLFVAALLLRDLWRQLGGSVAAANLAAFLLLANPATAAYAQWLWSEVPHLALLLAALCLLARPPAPARAFLAGLALGLALLAKSLLAGFWPFFLLPFLRRERPFLAWRPALALLLGLGVVTGPALLHGWQAWGRPMIADSSMYNLWVGLNDRWRGDYIEDMGGITLPAFLASGETPQERNAIYLGKVRALIAERGPWDVLGGQLSRQYFRLFNARTPLVSQLPGEACAGHLSVYRSPPWLTRVLTGLNDLFHALILAGAAFGLACWRRRLGRTEVLVALFLAYQLALFLFLHAKARFLLPMLPFLGGLAASFALGLAHRSTRPAVGGEELMDFTAKRLVVGALLATLLLALAFGGPLIDRPCAR